MQVGLDRHPRYGANPVTLKVELFPTGPIVKGVPWSKTRHKWLSQTKCNGKTINLGRFDTIEEAKTAYIEGLRRLHG
jgi:hypothetical protein